MAFSGVGGTQFAPMKYAETKSAREQLKEVNRHFGIQIEPLLILTSLLDIKDIYIEPIYLEFLELKITTTVVLYRKPKNSAECQCGSFGKNTGCVCGYIVVVDKKQDDNPQVYTGRTPIESYIGSISRYEPLTVIEKIRERIPKNTFNKYQSNALYYDYSIALRPPSDYKDIVLNYINDSQKVDEIIKIMKDSSYNGILDIIENNQKEE